MGPYGLWSLGLAITATLGDHPGEKLLPLHLQTSSAVCSSMFPGRGRSRLPPPLQWLETFFPFATSTDSWPVYPQLSWCQHYPLASQALLRPRASAAGVFLENGSSPRGLPLIGATSPCPAPSVSSWEMGAPFPRSAEQHSCRPRDDLTGSSGLPI